MLIGDPKTFALESHITLAFEQVSQRALGYFIIHVAGMSYGVRQDNASLLACSFNEVGERIAQRGQHRMECLSDLPSVIIAERYVECIYGDPRDDFVFGIPQPDFLQSIYASQIIWAPDGDEAFDDGSHVLQLDVDDRVRLIAFQIDANGQVLGDSLRSIWLNRKEFYGVLECWQRSFAHEWTSRLSER